VTFTSPIYRTLVLWDLSAIRLLQCAIQFAYWLQSAHNGQCYHYWKPGYVETWQIYTATYNVNYQGIGLFPSRRTVTGNGRSLRWLYNWLGNWIIIRNYVRRKLLFVKTYPTTKVHYECGRFISRINIKIFQNVTPTTRS
jgi:hypothetical protein